MTHRTSFELPQYLWDQLEEDSNKKGVSKVFLIREIIEKSAIRSNRLKRSIVDFRLGEETIQKLQDLADSALPEKAKSKGRKGNKSAALQEILLQYYRRNY